MHLLGTFKLTVLSTHLVWSLKTYPDVSSQYKLMKSPMQRKGTEIKLFEHIKNIFCNQAENAEQHN